MAHLWCGVLKACSVVIMRTTQARVVQTAFIRVDRNGQDHRAMCWLSDGRRDEPNEYGTDGLGKASRAQLQAEPSCLPSDNDPLFKVYRRVWSLFGATEKSRGGMDTRSTARTRSAIQDDCLRNRLDTTARSGMKRRHEGP